MSLLYKVFGMAVVAVATLAFNPIIISSANAADFLIDRARWDAERSRLTVRGDGDNDRTVTVTNADTGAPVGTDQVNDEQWRVRVTNPASVPCRVRAVQSNGDSAERNVNNAPADCDDGGGTTPPPGGGNPPDIGLDLAQTDFKIMLNYELGMHCTGFEFAYCCVLPAYNSILAQVVKPEGTDGADFPELVSGDPNVGLDGLGRETVLRDKALDGSGNFKKYVLRYWHDAQPRNNGRGKVQTSTLISNVEGNSLLSWNTVFDSAMVDANGALVYGAYNGSDGVLQGDGDFADPTDNYQNSVWNHLYFYDNLEGGNASGSTLETDKTRLGVNGQVVYPENTGAALHPMGPVNEDPASGSSGGPFDNVLTFSGHNGTVVYTQMKVLENLPIMLTSPDIWEALGLPLTPFEDSIDFFGDPGLVDEDSVRPYVAMKAQLYHYDGAANDQAVIGSTGDPVIGFGTAPIDIPNCERCHSNAPGTANSPNSDATQWAMVQEEYNFWSSFYGIDTGAGDSDWYSRLKSAAISMLKGHDREHGTSFTDCYPYTGQAGCADFPAGVPQNTRLGHESVICQRCHADNVIAVVKSATHNGGDVIPPITEAIHNNHRSVSETTIEDGVEVAGPITFSDASGRDGGCQGCHPAHRSDGDMSGYPITLAGTNFYANDDNRNANGGCFVGRDVHSNPGKDSDGAETPEHLNAVGQWLSDNVYSDQGPNGDKGIWCTNCHNQLGQEIWKTENMEDLVHGVGITNPRAEPSLAAVAAAVGTTEDQAIAWIDPGANDLHGTGLGDFTHAIWDPDPGLCAYVADYVGGAGIDPAQDGGVATVEVSIGGGTCSNVGDTNAHQVPVDCGFVTFDICGSVDGDGDFSVNLVAGSINNEEQSPFCTTPDCVAAAQATLNSPCGPGAGDRCAVPVPYSAATDGRDHWLAGGEPHCADCHAAPYVEQSGNINAYPPFNYPRKASLMRYSRGHQDISCQGCHESIHGLYPVTPTIDTTSYAQAASLNHDGSHGPLKCGTCHDVDNNDIPTWIDDLEYTDPNTGQVTRIGSNFDRAVSWMHTYTKEADPRQDVCLNCHGNENDEISWNEEKWTEHAMEGRTSRQTMDTVEALQGINMNNPLNTLCESCHGDERDEVSCNDREWKEHLTEGRVSVAVWEDVSRSLTGSTCGW